MAAVSIPTGFRDNREYSYFLYFREKTAPELANFFECKLWSLVLLQASWNQPIICHLISSIGALNKAKSLGPVGPLDGSCTHHQYAFRQYGGAIKSIRAILSPNGHQDIRTLFVASILIHCFETMCGSYESASAHTESALRFLRKQLAISGRRFNHLKLVSPIPALEEELIVAFVRLDNGLMSKPPESDFECLKLDVRSCILDIEYSDDPYDIPQRFSNLQEARIYLEHFQFRALPRLINGFATAILERDSPITLDEGTIEQFKMISQEQQLWNAAYAPLYAESLQHSGSRDSAAAATLLVQAISTDIAAQFASGVRFTNADTIGDVNASFHTIIELSKRIMADSSYQRVFVWHCCILPSLFITVAACGNMALRQEALQLLTLSIPRREGTWDSVPLAKIGRMILQASCEAGGS